MEDRVKDAMVKYESELCCIWEDPTDTVMRRDAPPRPRVSVLGLDVEAYCVLRIELDEYKFLPNYQMTTYFNNNKRLDEASSITPLLATNYSHQSFALHPASMTHAHHH